MNLKYPQTPSLILAILSAVIALTATSCAKSLSTNIDNSEIYAIFSVTGNGSSVSCSGELRVGGALGTYIELSGGDTLSCSDGTNTSTMAESDLFGMVSYDASGLAYGTSRTYTITFTRASGESFSGTAMLPPAPAFISPAAGAMATQGASLNVTWTANGGTEMDVTLSWMSGTSSGSYTMSDQPDNGSATLPAQATTPASVTGAVGATLTLVRENAGTPPSGLKGGTMSGRNSSARAITLQP